MNLDDFLDHFNVIDRVQGILWGLTSWLPYRRSHKGRKEKRLRIDGGTRTIRVDIRHTSGREAEDILAAAHIPIAGRRIRSQEAIFLVRARQAAWAELLLLRAGVKLADSHKLIDPENVRYAAGKGAVPLWGDPRRGEMKAEAAAQQQAGSSTPAPKPAPRKRSDLRARLEEWL